MTGSEIPLGRAERITLAKDTIRQAESDLSSLQKRIRDREASVGVLRGMEAECRLIGDKAAAERASADTVLADLNEQLASDPKRSRLRRRRGQGAPTRDQVEERVALATEVKASAIDTIARTDSQLETVVESILEQGDYLARLRNAVADAEAAVAQARALLVARQAGTD